MTLTTALLFSIVALVTIAAPGPTVLLALSNGTRYGVRRSVPGMLGAVASDIVLVTAVALGLGALLAASEFWFSASSHFPEGSMKKLRGSLPPVGSFST